MSRNKIPDRVQLQVRERANYLCEYCHANERWQYVRFTVDHVVPVSLGYGVYTSQFTIKKDLESVGRYGKPDSHSCKAN